MKFNRDFRLSREILWLFKLKARISWAKNETLIFMQLDEIPGYEVDKAYGKSGQYEPNYLFGGRLQRDGGRLEEVIRLLAKGHSNRFVCEELNACHKYVAKVKRIVTEYRGAPITHGSP